MAGLPVNVVKIHHEGAGVPNDVPKNGYSVWIGPAGPQLVRAPTQDWSTLNLNGVVLGVCFSGQRQDGIAGDPAHPVTDAEIVAVASACAQARARGWITAVPVVSPHDNLSGSATVCPGSQVYARWNEIVAAVECGAPAPKTEANLLSFPAPNPPDPNRFHGVAVDLDKRAIVPTQPGITVEPLTINNPNPWNGGYAFDGGFAIWTADTDLYHFHWK